MAKLKFEGRSFLAVFIAVALIFAFTGLLGNCVHTQEAKRVQQQAFKVLQTSKIAYTASLREIGNLYRAGVIHDDVRTEAVDVGRKYKDAHNLAVEAYRTWMTTGKVEDQESFDKAFDAAMTWYSEFMDMATKYLTEKGG